TAAAGSPWITAVFTIPNRCCNLRRYARFEFRPVTALFGRQENHARKLEHRGDKLKDNRSEEWPECAEEDSVVQLQEDCCCPEGCRPATIRESIRAEKRLPRRQNQPARPRSARQCQERRQVPSFR